MAYVEFRTSMGLDRNVATHFWMGGTHFSGLFGVGSVEGHVFYGTDKYVTWLCSIYTYYRHNNRKIVMKLERVKLETVKNSHYLRFSGVFLERTYPRMF